MPKRVSIEEAENGFMVSSYSDSPGGGEKKVVCKTMEEAKAAMEKMMTGKRRAEKRN